MKKNNPTKAELAKELDLDGLEPEVVPSYAFMFRQELNNDGEYKHIYWADTGKDTGIPPNPHTIRNNLLELAKEKFQQFNSDAEIETMYLYEIKG